MYKYKALKIGVNDTNSHNRRLSVTQIIAVLRVQRS